MIPTLSITIFIEGLIALGYCLWRQKPVRPILLTVICANIVTQSLLWAALNFFYSYYLIALLIAEILVWLMESLILYLVRSNRLRLDEAMSLSLGMNLISFGLGWFLPF